MLSFGRLVTGFATRARLRSCSSPREICGELSGSVPDFYPNTSFLLHHLSLHIHASIIQGKDKGHITEEIFTKTLFHLATSKYKNITWFTVWQPMVCDFRLPPRCLWDLRSSGILRSVEWWSFTDVSGQPVGIIFKCQEVQEEKVFSSWTSSKIKSKRRNIFFVDSLTLEYRTDRLSRNAGEGLLLDRA
jgi:hypothetical protein